MSREKSLDQARELLSRQRWAALATIAEEGTPESAMVAYSTNEALTALYLHLSELAAHTRNLLREPRASLTVSQPDTGLGDPQQLMRLTLYGAVIRLPSDTPEYMQARERYLKHLPDSRPLFEFGDFHLFCLRIERARFVGGFGRAYTFDGAALGQCNA